MRGGGGKEEGRGKRGGKNERRNWEDGKDGWRIGRRWREQGERVETGEERRWEGRGGVGEEMMGGEERWEENKKRERRKSKSREKSGEENWG